MISAALFRAASLFLHKVSFLCTVHYDYIIIGQGICGTFLSWNLLRHGKTVLVIDKYNPVAASRVASGVINPVTGRRIVRTWMIEELLPFAEQAYEEIGRDIDMQVARRCGIYSFHNNEQMAGAWRERTDEGEEYLQNVYEPSVFEPYFNLRQGIGLTYPCMVINLGLLLDEWRKRLVTKQILLDELFDINECTISDTGVHYKDIQADKLIFCNGTAGYDNPYFKRLPFALSKGEAIIAEIKGLSQTDIYKQGMNIVPWGENGLFWIGSSFEWEYDTEQPTVAFRQKTETLLKEWLRLPYRIIDHVAAIRPASLERRPFVGLHPAYPAIGILNGMGTKGCSLAPYFAHQLTQNLLFGTPVNAKADIRRFEKILNR